MSRESSKQSNGRGDGKKKGSKALDRPFDPELFARARKIALQYRVITEPEGREYFGTSVEMPGVFVHGATEAQCVAQAREALTVAVATMMELDQRPPSPASDERREAQVNIRLTPNERMRIEETARQEGFRSISDYMRHTALRGPR